MRFNKKVKEARRETEGDTTVNLLLLFYLAVLAMAHLCIYTQKKKGLGKETE